MARRHRGGNRHGKGRIIKPNCTAMIGRQPHEDEVMPIMDRGQREPRQLGARRRRIGSRYPSAGRWRPGGHPAHSERHLHGSADRRIRRASGTQRARRTVRGGSGDSVNGALDGDLVAEALSSVHIPGRIEQIRTSPTIILDGGHNVNAAESLRAAIEENYDFQQLVGVVAMMREKQVEEYLGVLEPLLSHVIVTENSWRDRVMPAGSEEDRGPCFRAGTRHLHSRIAGRHPGSRQHG